VGGRGEIDLRATFSPIYDFRFANEKVMDVVSGVVSGGDEL
jgi:hypothetical protein